LARLLKIELRALCATGAAEADWAVTIPPIPAPTTTIPAVAPKYFLIDRRVLLFIAPLLGAAFLQVTEESLLLARETEAQSHTESTVLQQHSGSSGPFNVGNCALLDSRFALRPISFGFRKWLGHVTLRSFALTRANRVTLAKSVPSRPFAVTQLSVSSRR
jgi:hypothetical protein